jgi:hypothetical protein
MQFMPGTGAAKSEQSQQSAPLDSDSSQHTDDDIPF